MKTIIFLLSMLIFSASIAAQSDYKVVFDITSKDTVDHKNVLRWVNEIAKADTEAQVEIVFYGQSLDMVVKDKSIRPDVITSLAANKNVSFKVCKVAMKAHNIESSQLLTGVQTVPDGLYEIVQKQKEGWAYIKVSH